MKIDKSRNFWSQLFWPLEAGVGYFWSKDWILHKISSLGTGAEVQILAWRPKNGKKQFRKLAKERISKVSHHLEVTVVRWVEGACKHNTFGRGHWCWVAVALGIPLNSLRSTGPKLRNRGDTAALQQSHQLPRCNIGKLLKNSRKHSKLSNKLKINKQI